MNWVVSTEWVTKASLTALGQRFQHGEGTSQETGSGEDGDVQEKTWTSLSVERKEEARWGSTEDDRWGLRGPAGT